MRYDRLNVLLDRVTAEQEEYLYFLLLKDGTVVRQQDGVFRTNCIDCLDRTNVLQSLLARRNLQQVFVVRSLQFQKFSNQLVKFIFFYYSNLAFFKRSSALKIRSNSKGFLKTFGPITLTSSQLNIRELER